LVLVGLEPLESHRTDQIQFLLQPLQMVVVPVELMDQVQQMAEIVVDRVAEGRITVELVVLLLKETQEGPLGMETLAPLTILART
jgi:hypothetical protein